MDKTFSLEDVKKILTDNLDKPLWYIAKLLNRKDDQEIGNLYRKLGIEKPRYTSTVSREKYLQFLSSNE